MKSEYIKAIRKMAVSLFGEVDEHAYNNEVLEEMLDYYFRKMSKIPEKRLEKAVDNFVVKGKTKNSWFFSDYAVIKFNKEKKCIYIEQPNIKNIAEISLDPLGVAVKLYSLEKIGKGLYQSTIINGQFENYGSDYDFCRVYEFKKQLPSFEDCYYNFVLPYALEEIGDNFLPETYEELKQKELRAFPAKDDFGNVTIRYSVEDGREILSILHPEHKNIEDRLRIPKMQQELFFFDDGCFCHKTIAKAHTKYGLKHFEETGENIFRGSIGTSLFIFQMAKPAEYYKLTNNPELIESKQAEIRAIEEKRKEQAKHEIMLVEAGKPEEKPKTTPKRKPKAKVKAAEQEGKVEEAKPEEKPQPAKKQTAKTSAPKTARKKTETAKTKQSSESSSEKTSDDEKGNE